MPYSIRLMDREDIRQVAEIDREAFPTQWPPTNYKHELQNQLARYIVACDDSRTAEEGQRDARTDGSLHKFFARIKQWLGRNHLPGNEPGREARQYIVGFAGIWALADEAHITNIAVRKDYQGRGIGELLLIILLGLARDMKTNNMTLEVRVSNITAQTLYLKYGFAQVGLRRGYYIDNREDGLLMSTESFASPSFQARMRQLKQAYSEKWGIAEQRLAADSLVKSDER